MNPRLQAALDAIAHVADRDEGTHAKLAGMVFAYDDRWGAEHDHTPEAVCELEAWHRLAGTRMSVAGKLDFLEALEAKRVRVVDHKTSAYLLDPTSIYWKQLGVDTQGLHYQALLRLKDIRVVDMTWDVITKPTIRLKQNEEPEAYTHRVREWYAEKGYDNTIVRRSVVATDDEVDQYLRDLYRETRDILHARKTKFWRKNPQACMSYGTPCTYLGICSGYDTPDSDTWEQGSSHPELSEPVAKKRDLLTHSRMSCFRLCPRKHLYRYEMGLRRKEEEEVEALTFGTLWHLAMDAWWMTPNTGGSDGL